MTTTKERHQDQSVKFDLGRVVITAHAQDVLDSQEVQSALVRHATGDWGDVCREDRLANERGLKDDDRLFSVYHAANSRKFWIITEWDRSVTTILVPEDY